MSLEAAMREIVNGIFTWSKLSERHGYDFNGFLVKDPGGNLCIDPVEPDRATLDEIVDAGVATIVLTNRNHLRSANLLRERTGARVLVHPADAAHVREQGGSVDGGLEAGDRLGPFRVVAAAGKSPGEVALHWPERRLLIVGDSVIGNPKGRCSLLPDKVVDDPRLLQRSVRRLLDLEFDALLVGDGTSILTDAKKPLRELVSSFPGSS